MKLTSVVLLGAVILGTPAVQGVSKYILNSKRLSGTIRRVQCY